MPGPGISTTVEVSTTGGNTDTKLIAGCNEAEKILTTF